jgi:hypothetical protein
LKETRPLWPPQRGVGLQEPNLGKTNLRVSLAYSLGICFAPSRGLVYISNANPACSCVYIYKFQFRPIHPPSRRLSSGIEVPEPCVHANVAVGEVLEPCVRGNVAVRKVPEPCRSTAIGAAGILLTSPCFRRGLRTTVVMDARGEPSLLVSGASQMGRRSCSLVA